MDKAEEIFAEGIEDRNVKTIRQARVLFVICLMAGMFIIFESDDIFKWAAVLAVYFFTDSFYKKSEICLNIFFIIPIFPVNGFICNLTKNIS